MQLTGSWRLVGSRAWNAQGVELPSPYGDAPLGQLTLSGERMLAALCTATGKAYSSYGGLFEFDGTVLRTTVDMASDPSRIGSIQTRGVKFEDGYLILMPPMRQYGENVERREVIWEALVPRDSA